MSEERPASFVKEQQVMYGNHGICIVVGEANGPYGPMIVIRTGNGVLVQVPLSKAAEALKPVAVVSPIGDVIAKLKRPAKKSRKSWNKKERDHAAVLGTADAVALASIIVDLHPRDKAVGLESYQLYQAALYQLVELLRVAENTDVPTVLQRLRDGTGLRFREDDAKPSTYAARSRSGAVKSPPAKETSFAQVRLPKARPVAALPKPAAAPKLVVEKSVMLKASPTERSAVKPLAKPPATVPAAVPKTQPVEVLGTSGDVERTALRQELGRVRRNSALRKRRVDKLADELKLVRQTLKDANRTIDMQAAKLATGGVDELLEALVVKKQEIDAMAALIVEKDKEVNRLNERVQRRDETIITLREQALTDKRLQDEIEAVRVDLFQYIFERTEAVERLQAYIRELQERSMQ